MYRSTERTRANARTQLRRIEAAARTQISAGGFRSATMKSVAARAGCSVGLIYAYFPNRDALLREAFSRTSGYELEVIKHTLDWSKSVDAAIGGLVSVFVSRALTSPRLAYALLFEALPPNVETQRLAFRARYASAVADRLQRSMDSGDIPTQNPHVAGDALVGAIAMCLQAPLTALSESGSQGINERSLIEDLTTFCRRAVGLTELRS